MTREDFERRMAEAFYEATIRGSIRDEITQWSAEVCARIAADEIEKARMEAARKVRDYCLKLTGPEDPIVSGLPNGLPNGDEISMAIERLDDAALARIIGAQVGGEEVSGPSPQYGPAGVQPSGSSQAAEGSGTTIGHPAQAAEPPPPDSSRHVWRHAVRVNGPPMRCPFCAQKRAIPIVVSPHRDSGPYWVRCWSCKAQGPEGESTEHALILWRMRVDPVLADAQGWGEEASRSAPGESTRRAAEPPPPHPYCDSELCQACGKHYLAVYSVPDEIWDAIRPSGKPPGGGLLCPACAAYRIHAKARAAAFEECAKIADAVQHAYAWHIRSAMEDYQEPLLADVSACNAAEIIAVDIRAAARDKEGGE